MFPSIRRWVAVGGCAAVVLAASGTAAAAAAADPPTLPPPGVTCVGPSPVPFSGLPWATARMAPYQVWGLTQGAGVTVAVIDSGVSAGASGLQGAVAHGTDVLTGGRADRDCFGRGTALAQIVAGRPVARTAMVGMAPSASVLPIRVVDGQGQFTVDGLIKAVRAATTARAGVILVGTGTPGGSPALASAVADAVRAGIVVVAPVDDGTPAIAGQAVPVWYPAGYDQVVAVGGVNTAGAPTQATSAASNVEVLAPSVGAIVPGPSGTGAYTVGGSAVAAAYVAGTVALLRSRYPAAGVAEIRDRLRLTAEASPTGGAPTIDPYAAVTTVEPQAVASTGPSLTRPIALPAPARPDPTIARAWLSCAAIVAAATAAVVVRRLRRNGR